jgi:hypothetical protein
MFITSLDYRNAYVLVIDKITKYFAFMGSNNAGSGDY